MSFVCHIARASGNTSEEHRAQRALPREPHTSRSKCSETLSASRAGLRGTRSSLCVDVSIEPIKRRGGGVLGPQPVLALELVATAATPGGSG